MKQIFAEQVTQEEIYQPASAKPASLRSIGSGKSSVGLIASLIAPIMSFWLTCSAVPCSVCDSNARKQ